MFRFVIRGEWESHRDRQSSMSSDDQEDMYHHQQDPLPSRKSNSRYGSADLQVTKVQVLNYNKELILSEVSFYSFIYLFILRSRRAAV